MPSISEIAHHDQEAAAMSAQSSWQPYANEMTKFMYAPRNIALPEIDIMIKIAEAKISIARSSMHHGASRLIVVHADDHRHSRHNQHNYISFC